MTTNRLVPALTLIACIAAAESVKGQIGNPWQVELGAFGTYTRYDKSHQGLDSKLGAGGRIALFVSRRFSVELHGDYTSTDSSGTGREVQVVRTDATLFAHTPGNTYVGLGYGRAFYSGGADSTDGGPHAILGIRLPLGRRAAVRFDGRLDYLPNSKLSATGGAALNLGVSAGLSIFAFGGPPRDDDRDGVSNKADSCPDTPLGAIVDERGCPLDADMDGVFDGLDQCPDTPDGAFVDIQGCPSDTDEDGVVDGVDVCPNTPVGAQVDANGCPLDSDADGVFDGLDQCPDTPAGATVDPNGCPSDSDADGVFDGIDQCPNTPPGSVVDERGCPVDDDADGVLNTQDECPGTPPGTEVDGRGCTIERDTDGDGVPDNRDRCPNTAPGQEVDETGCPVLFQVEQGVVRPLVLRGVAFETGRSALTQDSYGVLDEVAENLVARPDVRIEVGGHTDNTGSRAVNMRLSLERAQAVKAYLARRGVEPSRMEAVGYGPDHPIATNATAAGRAQNRRVELKRLDNQGR
jgi:outer membrane protein OmpA-like peptidoglycan-associated protein